MKSNRLDGAQAPLRHRCAIAHSLSVPKCIATTKRRTTVSFVEGAERAEATRADAKAGAASPYRTVTHRLATNRPPPPEPFAGWSQRSASPTRKRPCLADPLHRREPHLILVLAVYGLAQRFERDVVLVTRVGLRLAEDEDSADRRYRCARRPRHSRA